jgi:hypothetical protein
VTSPEPIHRLEAVLSPVFLLLVSDGQRLAFHDDIVGVLLGTAQPVWTSDARGGTFGLQHVLRVPDGAVYTTSNAGVFRYEPR